MDPHQTKIYTAILTTSFLLGAILVYFLISLLKHQKRNMELNRRNLLSEITTLEKEHTRMARDLHDELGPILTAVKFNISSVAVVEEDAYLLQRATDQLDEAILRIREVARDLMPVSLTGKGLKLALDDFTQMLVTPVKIEILYHVASAIDDEKSLHLYRLIKEMIHNTLKHAGATHLHILLEEKNSKLRIVCEDNGKGFDYEKILLHSKGIGLRNLKSRTELMGGQLSVFSVEGEGTQYSLTIPLLKQTSHD